MSISFQADLKRTENIPLSKQLYLWKNYALANEEKPFYSSTILVTKDKTTQIYFEDDFYQHYIPSVSHFINNPGLVEHYRDSRTSLVLHSKSEFNITPFPMVQNNEDEDLMLEDDD